MFKFSNSENYLGKFEDIEYEYVFSNTKEFVLIEKRYIDCLKRIGLWNFKGKLLEKQTPFLIPNFLSLYLELMGLCVKDFIDNASKEEIEEAREKILDINLKELFKDIESKFDVAVNNIRDNGGIVNQEIVNSFNNSLEFDKHPLDSTLKLSSFTKVYSNRDYRIKKEYSVRFSLNYSISIACVRYINVNEKSVILDYTIVNIPYDIILKICNLISEDIKIEGE